MPLNETAVKCYAAEICFPAILLILIVTGIYLKERSKRL
jgi:hypothetical protein